MMRVTIKFKPFFEYPMLTGLKVCTARTKRMGHPGDTFEAFGQRFEIQSVTEECLSFVSDLWEQEGCTSRAHFLDVWKEIHPVVGYRPKQIVFLHRFTRVQR